jgi:hypothetical protein
MNDFVVVVFSTEAKAREGLRELEALHREGTVTVFETALLQRDAGGATSVTRLGGVRDFAHAMVMDAVLANIEADVARGGAAVIAEVLEDSSAPIDTRMERLGGKVSRHSPREVVRAGIEPSAAAARAEIADVIAEEAGRNADLLDTKLGLDIQQAREKLQRTADKARQHLDHVKAELDAKLWTLEHQAARAKPEVRAVVDRRIRDVRQDLEERETKLRRAYDLTQEALRT